MGQEHCNDNAESVCEKLDANALRRIAVQHDAWDATSQDGGSSKVLERMFNMWDSRSDAGKS